jgi:hypothetical protein
MRRKSRMCACARLLKCLPRGLGPETTLSRSARERLFDGPLQSLDGRRFRDACDNRFSLDNDLSGVRMPGYKYHRDAALGYYFRRREAVNDWHIEIDERDVDIVAFAMVDQFLAIANRTDNRVAEALEQPNEHLANVGLVIGNGDTYGRGAVV